MDSKTARKWPASPSSPWPPPSSVKDAALDMSAEDPYRVGGMIGNGIGGYEIIHEATPSSSSPAGGACRP
jgi:hypothetical protein